MAARPVSPYRPWQSPRTERETAMTSSRVTELPLHLEPMAPDPFLGEELVPGPALRELDHRRNDGIDVRLLWNPAGGGLVVTVSDARSGDAFAMPVDAVDALDAFHHPYAHAAFRGVEPRAQAAVDGS
jgi:hypothetical protein